MKKLKKIVLSLCIVLSINFYVQQQADSQTEVNSQSVEKATTIIQNPCADSANILKSSNSEKSQSTNIIPFISAQNNDVSGSYWPAPAHQIVSPDGKPINTASAYIENDTYSDVIELKELLPEIVSPSSEIELMYLGYFNKPESQEKIYLYGAKDKKDSDDDEDDDDE
ncbi:MAG: hypothetical protein JO129_02325 [Candidatus Dependentiae bacterium]|nr:hypothetical protein [Candidatus Dependentiae bacterium]